MSYIELYELISRYYPIGIDRKESFYENYKGSIELKTLKNDFLQNPEKKAKWDTFVNKMKMTFPELDIRERSMPFDVCYSIVLLINKTEVDDFIYTQQLYCHLSFLGNYFCLYGEDRIQVNSNNIKIQFDPFITISPMNNYDKYFDQTRKRLGEMFPTYNFLCHSQLAKRINGLKIFSNLLKGNQFSSVFQALFIPENKTDYRKCGDLGYK